jgi:hypothetical protein
LCLNSAKIVAQLVSEDLHWDLETINFDSD